MNYLITLIPLKPFFFGGDVTFGKLGDKEEGNYLVKSRLFPQQTAILGMIRKEILIQAGLLTTKVNGEWVDNKEKAKELIGDTKFKFNQPNDFGDLERISPVFLMRKNQKFIKKVAIDRYEYKKGLLYKKNQKDENDKYFTAKDDMYDNFISTDNKKCLKTKAIFREVVQVGNKKKATKEDPKRKNSFYKKTSYLLKDNFKFAFYIKSDFKLENSFVTLGADKSTFKMEVKKVKDDEWLKYEDKNGYLTLLSDAYIDVPLKDNCEFAITSEISFGFLENKFEKKKRIFKKSDKTYYLYEKGSVFIGTKPKLIDSLENEHLEKIGMNIFTQGEKK